MVFKKVSSERSQYNKIRFGYKCCKYSFKKAQKGCR